jgi:hypothetical protein
MNAQQVPLIIEPDLVKWDEIELFRRRFGVLWSNLRDLELGQFTGGFTKQADCRYTGGFELPNEHRLKGLYVDFRHFYLNDETTNVDWFANYLASLTNSKIFRQFIKEEKWQLRSRFIEDGWFEHKGKRLSTKQFLDVWFNAEIFHSNPRKAKTLLEWMDIFTNQTAKSMLFMAVYDSILAIRNINWAAMELSRSNMNLRMPNTAMQPMASRGRG